MLARVRIEHEVGQCTFELGALIPIHRKACARKLRGALQIKHSELLTQFPMWLWLKAELRRLPPTSDLNVVMLASSDGHAGVRQIRNLRHHCTQLLFELRCELLLAFSFFAQR